MPASPVWDLTSFQSASPSLSFCTCLCLTGSLPLPLHVGVAEQHNTDCTVCSLINRWKDLHHRCTLVHASCRCQTMQLLPCALVLPCRYGASAEGSWEGVEVTGWRPATAEHMVRLAVVWAE